MATKAKPAKKSTTKKTVKKAHSSKSSKKLNKKGIGQHLLLIIVAIVAVTGAAGFFVWQRQKNNSIDAKAAGYVRIASNSAASKYISISACKNPSRLGAGNYLVSFSGKRLNTNTLAYRISSSGWTWKTVYFNGLTFAYPPNKVTLKAYKTDKIDISYLVSGGDLPSEFQSYGSILASNIANC